MPQHEDRPDEDRNDGDHTDGDARPTGPTDGRERQPIDADEVDRSRERAEDLRRKNDPIGDQPGIVPTRRQDST